MKKRYVFGGIILVAAVGYLIYVALGSSTVYTVSELLDRGSDVYDTDVSIVGKVEDGYTWDAGEIELRFVVTEGNESLPVIYEDIKPDGFKAGADVMVGGIYHADKILRADSILLKCPSKYVPKE